MTQTPEFILVGIATIVGTFAGILGSLWWTRRLTKQRRRIPTHWPLDPRRMASSAECLVWRWLNRVFFDHHVMIKVPVTRFTMPHSKENSAHWYNCSAVFIAPSRFAPPTVMWSAAWMCLGLTAFRAATVNSS